MKSLLILEPITPAAIGGSAAGTNLLTPDPKEVYDDGGGGGGRTIDVDLGSVQSIDTLFVGFVAGADGATIDLAAISGGATGYADATIAVAAPAAAQSDITRLTINYFVQLAAPVNARYVRFTFTTTSNAHHYIGVLAIGKAWTTTWGHEWGAGRPVGDTSTVERLFGGGFGINVGATSSGFQWTFGDLTDLETHQLHALLRRVGKHGSVLVVEDPDTATVGLNERLHWGLFDKLEPYERLTVGATKWALRIEDWA